MEAVKRRRACRKFGCQPTEEEVAELARAIATVRSPVAGWPCARVVFARGDISNEAWPVPQSRGMLSGPKRWAVTIAERDHPRSAESAGFLLGKLWLLCTEQRMEGCCIGDDRLAQTLGVASDPSSERVFALFCFGHAAETTQCSSRLPWSTVFFDGKWGIPLTRSNVTDGLALCFESVRLAPSAFNLQPWRLVLRRDGRMMHVDFFDGGANTNEWSGVDIGIAMAHWTAVCSIQSCHWSLDEPPISFPDTARHIATLSWLRPSL